MTSPPHREVLQRDYGIDDLVFQQLATTVDIFKVALEAGAVSTPVDEWLPSPAYPVSASVTKTEPPALTTPTRATVEERSQAATGLSSATDDPIIEDRNERIDVVLYVVGGDVVADHNPAVRNFPLVVRTKGDSKAAHLARVIDLVDQAIASGGTHLLVPPEHADWLRNHPRVAKYLSEQHGLAEVSDTLGLVFTLQPQLSRMRSSGEASAPGRGSRSRRDAR
jgi:hypothetical protein